MHRGSQRSRCGSCNDLTKQSERPRVPTGPVGASRHCSLAGCESATLERLPVRRSVAGLSRGAGGTCAAVRRVLLTYLHTIVSTRRVAPNLTQDTHHAARTPDSPRRSFHVRHPTPSSAGSGLRPLPRRSYPTGHSPTVPHATTPHATNRTQHKDSSRSSRRAPIL